MRALVALAVLFAAPAHADGVFLGMHHGFVHFDGKQAKRLFKTPRFVTKIAQSAPGVLWLGSTLSVHRYNQGKLDEQVLDLAQYMRAANGVVWFGNQQNVSWFDGSWHEIALPVEGSLNDLEIDDQGRVWVISGGALYYTKGASWTTFVGPEKDVKFCQLATRGDLYLACWQDVYRLHQNTWSSVGKLDKVIAEDFYVAADGTMYLPALEKLHVLPPAGDAKVIALPKWNLRGFAVDGRGRMWFAHGDGLTVLDATGKKLKLPRALARSDEMHSIFVEGNGPDF